MMHQNLIINSGTQYPVKPITILSFTGMAQKASEITWPNWYQYGRL